MDRETDELTLHASHGSPHFLLAIVTAERHLELHNRRISILQDRSDEVVSL
jgi:hypothetical protein